ncbi:MAG: hypothetical protein HY397_01685 [Candidatus Doudnabacteria bacterium]|nr:hypothetical protein [Candidatus Doudnabacteria bacterium]
MRPERYSLTGAEEKKPEKKQGAGISRREFLAAGLGALAALSQRGDKPSRGEAPLEQPADREFTENFLLLSISRGETPSFLREGAKKLTPEGFVWHAANAEPLSESRKAELLDTAKTVSAEFGAEILWYLKEAHFFAEKKAIPPQPRFSGWAENDLPVDDIKDFFTKGGFPRGTIMGNVAGIRYDTFTDPNMQEGYRRVYGENRSLPSATASLENRLTFYRQPNSTQFEAVSELVHSFRRTAPHEVGHASSWMNRKGMKLSDRLAFLKDALAVYEEKERSKVLVWLRTRHSTGDEPADYEKIQNPNAKLQKYLQVEEMTADLFALYLDMNMPPVKFAGAGQEKGTFGYNATDKEKNLIHRYFLKDDPNFDPQKAWTIRHDTEYNFRRKMNALVKRKNWFVLEH